MSVHAKVAIRALQRMKLYHILTLTTDIKVPCVKLKVLTSTYASQSFTKIRCYWSIDPIFNPADSVSLKLTQLLMARSDFHETSEGKSAGEYLHINKTGFYIYYQRKNVADFHYLRCKLEPLTLPALFP